MSVTEGFFGYEDLVAIWEMDGESLIASQDAFMDTLDDLLNHRILSINGSDGYTMHALIRSFLINLDRGDGHRI